LAASTTTTTPSTGAGDRLLLLLALALIALGGFQVWSMLRLEPLGMDFLPLWTAGRMVWTEPGKVYDFAAVTAAQAWLPQPHFAWPRPYVDPPTTLLLLAPLGRLPFGMAMAVWSALSLGVFATASARLAGRNPALAAVVATALPCVVIAATAGQTVVLAAGLLVLAVLELERRPRLAGALLAMAGIVKPAAVVVAPIALVACGALEALASAAVVAAGAAALSTVFFGAERWSEWLASLPAYQRLIESIPGLGSAIISPFGVARGLSLPGAAPIMLAAIFAVGGGWLAWAAFRRAADPARRTGALAVGGLLAAPYSLCFDATLIAPAATVLAMGELAGGRVVMALLMLGAAFAVTQPNLGLPALLVFAALVMIRPPAPAPAGPATAAARP
jgi:hypothetical protein